MSGRSSGSYQARTDAGWSATQNYAPLPLRVVTSSLGGGATTTALHWRALDEHGALLAEGDAACVGWTTIVLPAAKIVRAVEVTARATKGERSVRLDRTEPPLRSADEAAVDRAHTRCAALAHALVKTAARRQYVVWMIARLGLVLVGLWIVGEAGALLARRALCNRATGLRQFVGGCLIMVPITWWLWTLAGSPHGGFHRTRLEDDPFVHFLQIARGGIAGECWFFSWSWWLPLGVGTSDRRDY